MSNVHGLHEFSSQSRQGYSREYLSSSDDDVGTHRLIGFTSFGPREQPTCLEFFFPGFKLFSATVSICIFQTILYFVTVLFGSSLLEPWSSTLVTFGGAFGPPVQRGEIWRVVTAMFLHASIWHIVVNTLFLLRRGFHVEREYGALYFLMLYFSSGIAGNLFSLALSPCKLSVGGSTASFGLIGLEVAEIVAMWHLQDKDQAVFRIAMLLVFSVILTLSPGMHIDWRGHLGGFIAGLWIGLLLTRHAEGQADWLKKLGVPLATVGLLASYIPTTLTIFLIPMEGKGGRCT